MGRRPAKTEIEVTWETTDNPYAMLPWVNATKILMEGLERRKLYMARIEKENPALYLVENLISFARRQDGVFFQTHSSITFRVEVPLDIIRKNKGILYISKASVRTKTESLGTLTEVAEHYQLTHSLEPSEYSKITRNAGFTLALVSLFVTQTFQDHDATPSEHEITVPPEP